MSDRSLAGKRIAFLAADGVEQVELERPWQELEEAGAEPELVSLADGEIQAFEQLEHGRRFTVGRPISEADASDYDALILPGGVANPDFLRAEEEAVEFTRQFYAAGKPIAAICHGPWLLVEAGVVAGNTLTSWPSLRTDIENAGGQWVDEEVCADGGLITSRKPDDLDAFCEALITALAESEQGFEPDAEPELVGAGAGRGGQDD